MTYTLGQTITVLTQSALIDTWTHEVKKPAQTVQAEVTKVGRGLALAGNGKNTHVVAIAEATVIEDTNVAEQFQTYKNLEGSVVTVGSSHRCGTYYGSNRNGWESQSNSHFFSEAPATCKNCNPNADKNTPVITKLDEKKMTHWFITFDGRHTEQLNLMYATKEEAQEEAKRIRATNTRIAKNYKKAPKKVAVRVHAPLG